MNKIFDKVNEQKNRPGFVVLFVVCSLLLNYVGRYTASTFQLPMWLDSIGTCLVAYMYGPLAGAVVGGCLPLSYGIFDPISCFYILSGVMIGAVCGALARNHYFDSFFKMNHVVAFLTFGSVLIATPINIIFRDGYINNIWADGVYDMLREMDVEKYIASFLGEFVLDFVDRYITLLIVFGIIQLRRKLKNKKIIMTAIGAVLVLFLAGGNNLITEARELPVEKLDQGFYTCTVYNDRNGLPGGEANDISYTHDGYVWIGTYSGLYRYDGAEFVAQNSDEIKNVNCLYTDDEGRMWVGTNDRGLAVMVGNAIANVVDSSTGLTSNSVSCIGCDSAGYYYIGTKDRLSVIKLVGGMEIVNTIEEIEYANSVASSDDGFTVVVDNLGTAFVLKDGELLYSFQNESDEAAFSCVEYCNGNFYIGTFINQIAKYSIDDNKASLISKINTKDLKNIHSIMPEDDGKIWIATSNGIGYWQDEKDVHILRTGSFTSSIKNSGIDYQGNLWFVSTRLGLLKISESVFANVYAECNVTSDVINAVTLWNEKLYFGSDDGLDVMSTDYIIDTDNELAKQLEGQRVRNLYVDSKNHLWIAVSAGSGLWEVEENGNITKYTEEDGMLCNRFRSVTELEDGTIAVAQDAGIDFLKNGKKFDALSVEDGFSNAMVLSICELENGNVYAGTDGGGIYLLKNRKIVDNITMEDGLSSDVILRIVEYNNGMLIVASNGLNYIDASGNVLYLDQFPYSNNFDIHVDGKNAWVLSSNGIYIVDIEGLIVNEVNYYRLLDSRFGLNGAITSNAWGLATEENELYIPCDEGCYVVNKKKLQVSNVPYRMSVDYTMADDVKAEMSASRVIDVPGDSRDVLVHILVPNYTENDIYVGYRLEGYEQQEVIVSVKELSEIKYTKLPSGEYRLVLNLYDESKTNVLESVYYTIDKQMRIFDYRWFKLYFVGVMGLFLIWSTWIIIKSRNSRILQKQREKLELLEHQAKVSNETIMAIAKTVDAKDSRTSKHSERVAQYSVCIAKALGWSEQECEDLYKTGLLHDIGKIGIPDAVLNKPGKLDDKEYAIMKTHVDKGAEILRGFTIVKDVDLGTRFHHERFDGKGYPEGLAGEEIPIQARIIGIADAFDAMTSNRVYRQKLDLNHVLEEMRRCAGTQFDPELTKLFLQLIEDGTIDVEVLYEDE